MNNKAVFSIIAACALSVAALAGASAAAIAAQTPMPKDGGSAGASPLSSTSLVKSATASGPAPTATAEPLAPADGVLARPSEPGDVAITAAQIRKVVVDAQAAIRAGDPNTPPVDPGVIDAVVDETVLDMKCMAGKGFYYNPLAAPGKVLPHWAPGAFVALWGDTGGGDAYRWQEAGCHGASVHITGNDNAN